MATATAQSWRTDPGPSFWVSLRYFALTRLIVAGVLLGAVLVLGDQSYFGESDPGLFLRSAVAYVVLSCVFGYFAMTRMQRFYTQLGFQLALDLVALLAMMHATDGTRGGIAVLFLLPNAGAAILAPPILAIGYAALSTLAILGETAWRDLTSDPATVGNVQAGFYGVACFAIAYILNRLAARLIAQERIARERGLDLRSQQEINRLVVTDMQDGVLIFDGQGVLRSLNPAAKDMLAVADPPSLRAAGPEAVPPAAAAIFAQFARWREHPRDLPDTFEVELGQHEPGDTDAATDRLRVRFVASGEHGREGTEYVVFIEDLRRMEERAQQLKLASMGRLTASIAHEIRNPLAAISHASALLAEDAQSEAEKRLLRIVQDNTRRLDRIVENILQLSRKSAVELEDVEFDGFLREAVRDFCRDYGHDEARVDISLYGRPIVRFNAEHLRQVFMNLLQNAFRYSSDAPGAICVVVVPVATAPERSSVAGRRNDRIECIVSDDGPGIAPEARAHLFEPFFTTHNRGTGLGLYLARELCLANGATLAYAPNADESKKGGFVINAAGAIR